MSLVGTVWGLWAAKGVYKLVGAGAGAACVAAVFAFLAVIVLWMVLSRMVRWLRGSGGVERAQQDRDLDPRRGWLQGAMFILQRGDDYAYVSAGEIRGMLDDAWGITTGTGLDTQVAELEAGDEEVAWNLLRAMLLLRSAVAVGWLTNDDSYARCLALGRRLQKTYRDGDAMAKDLLRSRRAWRGVPEDGSGDTDDMEDVAAAVEAVRASHWEAFPWWLSLESTPERAQRSSRTR